MVSTETAESTVSEIVADLKTFASRVILHGLRASDALSLAPTDLVCMCLLQLNGPATPGWLAQMTGLSSGAVTGAVDRLERAGYVRREPDPKDRRRVVVKPDLARWDRDLQRHAPDRAPASLEFLRSYTSSQLRVTRRFAADLAATAPKQPAPAPR
jgi:DNA-binding transcriptional ArsR family regulator